jgi:hypothetical protein
VVDATSVKDGIQALIFAPPVGLHGNNFAMKHSFNKGLKFFKELKNFRFTTQEIYPREFAIVIDETYVILLIAKGIDGRPPNI